jgi:Flp pilus assembly protein CpaB
VDGDPIGLPLPIVQGVHPARLIESLARAFRWHRRWFAALLASIAVLATLEALSPDAAGTVPVVVAAHEIAGGSMIAASDLEVLAFPGAVVPDGAIGDPAALVGSEVVVRVPARRPLTRADLLDAPALVGAGKMAVPVRFSDAGTVAILRVGSHIDVLGQSGQDAAVATIARNLRVVAIPGSDAGGVLGSSSAGGLVLVEADETQSAAILTAGSGGTLGYVLR